MFAADADRGEGDSILLDYGEEEDITIQSG